MTQLLEEAVAKVRELPEEDQDALAIALLAMAGTGAIVPPLDEEARSAIREGLEQARQGRLVPEDEIEALWRRHGL
jgi:predicted transcriptional regulator